MRAKLFISANSEKTTTTASKKKKKKMDDLNPLVIMEGLSSTLARAVAYKSRHHQHQKMDSSFPKDDHHPILHDLLLSSPPLPDGGKVDDNEAEKKKKKKKKRSSGRGESAALCGEGSEKAPESGAAMRSEKELSLHYGGDGHPEASVSFLGV